MARLANIARAWKTAFGSAQMMVAIAPMCDLQNLNVENGVHHLIMARYTVNQHAPKILDNGSPPVIQTGWGGIVGVGRTIFRKMIQINAKCKLCGFIPMTMTMCRRVWQIAHSVAWETSKKTAISAKQCFYSQITHGRGARAKREFILV